MLKQVKILVLDHLWHLEVLVDRVILDNHLGKGPPWVPLQIQVMHLDRGVAQAIHVRVDGIQVQQDKALEVAKLAVALHTLVQVAAVQAVRAALVKEAMPEKAAKADK
jgi:hypothetical protein